MPLKTHPRDERWYLENYLSDGRTWIVEVTPLPFVIGRQKGCHLHLSSVEISRRHAEIFAREGRFWIREFGSKNGTFVNRQQVRGEQCLSNEDILHIGPLEFRLYHEQATKVRINRKLDDLLTSIFRGELSDGFGQLVTPLAELLSQKAVLAYFQPLVQLSERRIAAYELLGRGNHPALPVSPWPLLQLAQQLHKAVDLSELLRWIGVQRACQLGLTAPLFLNTVPDESSILCLERSLPILRLLAPDLPLVLEIHEATVTDLGVIKALRALLQELNIQLAYDDFGAGQARLVELMAVPPDYLKFDRTLIHQLHSQSPSALRILRTLVHMAQDLGIRTVAEGIELKEELEACNQLGFDLAQGYYLGRPAPELLEDIPAYSDEFGH